jgi:hypothetical protein
MVQRRLETYRRHMTISSPTPELAEPEPSETPVSETEAAEIENHLRSLGYIE